MCSGICVAYSCVCGACLFGWLDIVFKNKVQLVDWFLFISVEKPNVLNANLKWYTLSAQAAN